jgi:hypothetical protein
MPYRGQMSGDGERAMITTETLSFELHGRLDDLLPVVGKTHISVRWEPRSRVARLGVCIDDYTWDNRMAVLERLLEFEKAHADELALEFDIVPLAAVEGTAFAES